MLGKSQNFASFFLKTAPAMQRAEEVTKPSGVIVVGRVTAAPVAPICAANNAHFAEANNINAVHTKARPRPHMHPM
jgi:hypothetical protein